jgi:DNA polymerase III delta prime subunit
MYGRVREEVDRMKVNSVNVRFIVLDNRTDVHAFYNVLFMARRRCRIIRSRTWRQRMAPSQLELMAWSSSIDHRT